MAKENDNQSTSGNGSKQKRSTQPSALITKPENRPVLVAKARDDLNVLVQAGFYVQPIQQDFPSGTSGVLVAIIAPMGDSLTYSKGKWVYNGKELD